MRTEHEALTPLLYFRGLFEAFDIIDLFSSGKIDLAAPKIMFLGTYLILYC